MIVYVIMLNDFPEGVRATEKGAEDFVDNQRAAWLQRGVNSARLYFKIHEFQMPEEP